MLRYAISVGAAAVLTAGVWIARADDPPTGRVGESGDPALVKRGEYLVLEVAHCGHCHTPRDAAGKPDRSKLLQGATLPIQPKDPKADWAEMSPDITKGGLAGKWGEAGLVKFLTTGKNAHGENPTAPMPAFHLKPDDARAVAQYLLSLPGKAK
jgi:mono/diheme cytochrome c family protein